jgi:hypothetical protein
MRNLRPDKDTETFNEAMACLKTAGRQIKEAQKEFDDGKKKVKMDLEELFKLVDDFPED